MPKNTPFRFVHCADLHLDTPFSGLHAVAPEIAATLRDATFRAFDSIISLALDRSADFILIAGDVFDASDRSLRAQIAFRDGVRRAVEAGIQCFIVHGNHDPLDGWDAGLALPEGAHRFGETPEAVVARRGGEALARVHGVSFPHAEVRTHLAAGFTPVRDGLFSIGLLHCNVGGAAEHDNYAPCSIEELAGAGLDYWALGHIHARAVLRESGPCIAYAGDPQGLSIKEKGERGCFLVDVGEDGRPSLEFVPTDAVRWFIEEVEIAGLTAEGLADGLASLVEDVRGRAGGRAAIVRVVLRGRGELHAALRRMDPERDLCARLRENESGRPDFVWVESVQDETRPAIDLAQRRRMEDFIGDFLRRVEAIRSGADSAAAVRELLARRPEGQRIAAQLEALAPGDLLELLSEAETLGLDRLLGEGA